jgi:hypothetical protein
MKIAQPPRLKTPKLTVKEIKLIKALVEGKSQGEAGMIATSATTRGSGATLAGRMLKKVDVQEALMASFEKHGITMDAAIAPIGKALTATKVIFMGSGDDAFAETVEDVDLQLKGSDRALKLMGIGRDEVGQTNNFVFIAGDQRAKYEI